MTPWFKRPAGIYTNNQTTLVKSGSAYFTLLLTLINEASASIHLQVYIIENDTTSKQVVEALINAAQRGVEVFILADGYASSSLPQEWIDEMSGAGIRFRFFAPILRSRNFYFGRRMHHKIFVADASHCLLGGINIGDRYNDTPTASAWLDFALYARGDVAQALCKFCLRKWKSGDSVNIRSNCDPVHTYHWKKNESSIVRIRRNDWVKNKNEISSTYRQLLQSAENEVTIFCSYFLPGLRMRRLFAGAIKRGIKIRVVTAGKSDVPISKSAERWLYDWLLRNGIGLYEYQPSVLHAKLAVCDDTWLTVGSYNVNQISAYASIEMNLDIYNPSFVAEVKNELQHIIEKDCVKITAEEHLRSKNMFIQFGRWCSYQFIQVVFSLFTFYFRRPA